MEASEKLVRLMSVRGHQAGNVSRWMITRLRYRKWQGLSAVEITAQSGPDVVRHESVHLTMLLRVFHVIPTRFLDAGNNSIIARICLRFAAWLLHAYLQDVQDRNLRIGS